MHITYIKRKKVRCGGDEGAALRAAKGGKGEPKSAAYGGLKRKSPPPSPPRSGYGNDGKPYGFTTFPQPPLTPLFPSDFLPFRERKRVTFFRLRGAFIINRFFPYFLLSL